MYRMLTKLLEVVTEVNTAMIEKQDWRASFERTDILGYICAYVRVPTCVYVSDCGTKLYDINADMKVHRVCAYLCMCVRVRCLHRGGESGGLFPFQWRKQSPHCISVPLCSK